MRPGGGETQGEAPGAGCTTRLLYTGTYDVQFPVVGHS